MSATIAVNGFSAVCVEIHVPAIGVWYADVDFADDTPDLPTSAFGCSVTIASEESSAAFVGTVIPERNGTFGLQRKVRIVGGGNGWGKQLTAKSYHNDARVKGSLVAQDAATECGERLPDASALQPLGVDYIRPAVERGVPVAAARVLEDACRGVPWWVGYDGITRIGARTPPAPAATDYTVISHHPRLGDVELAIDDVTKVGVGTVLDAGLAAPRTVTSLQISAKPESLRLIAWCGSGERTAVLDALRALIERTTDAHLNGLYRYRVIGMNGDRVDLQRCGDRKDLPNTVATSMWPGVAGAHAQLANGCEVLVAFIDGDRAQPAIVSFVGRGGPGDVPTQLELGGPSGSPAAREGDTVTGLLPPAVFVGTIVVGGVPSPATGAIVWSPPQIIATISTGSSKVKVKT